MFIVNTNQVFPVLLPPRFKILYFTDPDFPLNIHETQ